MTKMFDFVKKKISLGGNKISIIMNDNQNSLKVLLEVNGKVVKIITSDQHHYLT